MLKKYLYLFISLVLGFIMPFTISLSVAFTFSIPKDGNIVGAIQSAVVQKGESLGEIGRRFDVGVYEMIEANPGLNPWSPTAGSKVIIPTQFVLPKCNCKDSIIINLAEMRLYYFHKNENLVSTHPIGIGRKGWLTPLGNARITEKKKNPTWYPPKSIRASHAKKGKILPKFIPPGPKNPLGGYAMKISIPGYLIHATNRPGGIGVRSSSGCIRMFPEDMESLFYKTSIGTKIKIIHAPYKVGRKNNKIFIEAHEPLSDPYYMCDDDEVDILHKTLQGANIDPLSLDPGFKRKIIKKPLGYPILIK